MQTMTKVNERTVAAASGEPIALLSFHGDISSTSKDVLLGAYHRLGSTASKVLLDFTAVDYINSSGIAIVIQMLLEASKAGTRTIGIFGLTAHFQKVFTMVGINKYAALHKDEVAALAAV
jgi:anti-anti-sigma regulatory factor